VVEVERSKAGTTGSVKDSNLRLVKGGTIGATDRADTVTAWPASSADAYATYGSSSDLWGDAWSDTVVNGSTFGMAISAVEGGTKFGAVAQIDHVRITVYYTAASTPTAPQAAFQSTPVFQKTLVVSY
jgi:hypothetical protein